MAEKTKNSEASNDVVLAVVLPVRNEAGEGSMRLARARKPYTCRNCMQPGHNRRTCKNVPLAVVRNDNIDLNAMSDETQIIESSTTKRRYRCGNCYQFGHNKRTCSRAIMQQESNEGMGVGVPADAVSKGTN